jgi:ubiquinone/menaquinone biosynthesis C-methylase UbiE
MKHIIVLFLIVWFSPGCASVAPNAPRQDKRSATDYEIRADHDPDGIGKFYMGREIAQVMGHQAAAWLERSEREKTESPDAVIENMGLRPADAVADIGAGTGYFTVRIARRIPQGKVYPVDIQPEMLDILRRRAAREKLSNVIPTLGGECDPKLPFGEIDVVLMVDAYHEFSCPREMAHGVAQALKPGGRVILIEYRGEDPSVPIKALHKMTEAQARREMSAAGLRWVETKSFLLQQHFMVFVKPEA